MKKHIPNILTLFNLLSGLIALVFVFQQKWLYAALFVILGILFDYADGFVARKLNVSSPLGLQLDSLADMVTSGIVPAFSMFFLIQDALEVNIMQEFVWDSKHLLPFAGLLIALGSALRLAKFNVDDRQTTSFIGLPTPANALFIMALPLVIYYQKDLNWQFLSNPYVLVLISIASAYLLNAEIPLFSLKFKNYSWKDNPEKYILIAGAVLLIPFFKFLGINLVIILYLILSLFFKNRDIKKDEN